MKTPYFLIKENELYENINRFKLALEKYWPNSNLSYSVKTNSLPWILKYMKKNNVFAEVVSDEEYELSKMCNFNDNEIVFNGDLSAHPDFETIKEFIESRGLRCVWTTDMPLTDIGSVIEEY